MCVDILLLSTHKGVTSQSCVNKPLVCQIYLKPVDSRIQIHFFSTATITTTTNKYITVA